MGTSLASPPHPLAALKIDPLQLHGPLRPQDPSHALVQKKQLPWEQPAPLHQLVAKPEQAILKEYYDLELVTET